MATAPLSGEMTTASFSSMLPIFSARRAVVIQILDRALEMAMMDGAWMLTRWTLPIFKKGFKAVLQRGRSWALPA